MLISTPLFGDAQGYIAVFEGVNALGARKFKNL